MKEETNDFIFALVISMLVCFSAEMINALYGIAGSVQTGQLIAIMFYLAEIILIKIIIVSAILFIGKFYAYKRYCFKEENKQ